MFAGASHASVLGPKHEGFSIASYLVGVIAGVAVLEDTGGGIPPKARMSIVIVSRVEKCK